MFNSVYTKKYKNYCVDEKENLSKPEQFSNENIIMIKYKLYKDKISL